MKHVTLLTLFAIALLSPGVIRKQTSAVQSSVTDQTAAMTGGALQMAYSEAIGQDDTTYHFQPDSAGYTATNPAQSFNIAVTNTTMTVSIDGDDWQLSSNVPITNYSVVDNHLTLHRDGYDEWYINGPLGLQQGFTLYEPSVISFELDGTLTTTATADTLHISDSLTFSGLLAFDAIGKSVPVAFDVDDSALAYAYDDTGATYPITIDPWVQQAKLMASDGVAEEEFGSSVAVDGETVLVGVPKDNDNGISSGSVYVFVRNGTTWMQQAKLVPFDATAWHYFGSSVALSGDTALIGAYGDDQNGLSSGGAYVFVRNGTTWTQQAKLLADDGVSSDYFGSAVALDGETALIGAYFHNKAYVFVRSGTTWSQQAKLPFFGGGFRECPDFGYSVALSGDTALVGAPECSYSDFPIGRAYIFVRSGTIWSQQTNVGPSCCWHEFAHFGRSVALDGDTALIGSPGDGHGKVRSGAAYGFVRSGTMWTDQAKLLPSDRADYDYFGESVALDGNTALVGALHNDDHGASSGSAYVFTRAGTTWFQQVKLLPSDGASEDRFGDTVSLDGDTALTGATGDDCVGGDACGSTYVFASGVVSLSASAVCSGPNLEVTISAGDGPFDITASAGINVPVKELNVGLTTIYGPEKWDDVTVHESTGLESINLGQFKCRSDERPTLLTPAHQTHTTDPFPLFSWAPITDANNYRVFVFDEANPAIRTVDIRQNSGGPTSMALITPLPDGRLFWRVRGRQNRLWSLWSIRFTLFKDPAVPISIVESTPVPGMTVSPPNNRSTPLPVPTIGPGDGATQAPTLPAPPNSR